MIDSKYGTRFFYSIEVSDGIFFSFFFFFFFLFISEMIIGVAMKLRGINILIYSGLLDYTI